MQENQFYASPDAIVRNVTAHPTARIYKATRVENTTLGAYVTIGDYSRVGDSALAERSFLQRNNMVYSARLGRYSYTGKNATIWHADIGAFCSISWNVSIGGADHDYTRLTTHTFLYDGDDFDLMPEGETGYDRFAAPCAVGNDVWIGSNACILRGVTVGTGAVIAAGAVVTRDVESYTVVAGVPARPIKKRFDAHIAEGLLASRWWELPAEVIRRNYDLFNAAPDEAGLTRLLKLRDKFLGGEGN